MRLNNKEIDTIKDVIYHHLTDAQIYLFGSRVDEDKKGGDIDLFIVSDKKSYDMKVKIKAKLHSLLNKPVDIVWHSDFDREIEKEALKGVKL